MHTKKQFIEQEDGTEKQVIDWVMSELGDCSKVTIWLSDSNVYSVGDNVDIRLRLETREVGTEKIELWIFKGPISRTTSNSFTISLLQVAHYIDGAEVLFWDLLDCQHRINGEDIMRQTRENLGLE